MLIAIVCPTNFENACFLLIREQTNRYINRRNGDWVKNATEQQHNSGKKIWMKTLESFSGQVERTTIQWLPGWKQHSLIVVIVGLVAIVAAWFSRFSPDFSAVCLWMIATAIEKEMMRTRLCHSDKICHSFLYSDYSAVALAASASLLSDELNKKTPFFSLFAHPPSTEEWINRHDKQ